MEVGGDDRINALRPADHAGGHGVHQLLLPGDGGEFGGDFGGDLIPKHHAMLLGIGFGDHGEQFARALCRDAEGGTHDAGDAGAGEDRGFGGDFLRVATMGAAAMAGIFALGIFAHDHPVDIAGRHFAQRRGEAGQHAGGADIGVLIEALADFQPQAPERQIIGQMRIAHRAEEDGVEGF